MKLALLVILFIYAQSQSVNVPIVLPNSSNIVVSSNYPDNPFDFGGWLGYIIFLIIMIIIPIVFCLSCCCIMSWIYCLRCCGLLGGRDIKKGEDFYGYTKVERLILLIPYVIFYALIVTSSALAIVWTVSFVASAQAMTVGTENSINDIFNYPDTVLSTFNKFLDSAVNISNNSNGTLIGITGINNYTNQMVNRLNTIPPTLNSMQKHITDIQNNLTTIKNINSEVLKETGLTSTPQLSDIPDITPTQTALTSSIISVNQMILNANSSQNQVALATNNAQSNMNTFSKQIVKEIYNTRQSSNDIFQYLNTTILDVQNALGITQNKRTEYFGYVYLSQTLFTIIFCILYAIPPFILVCGICNILIGKSPLQCCMSVGACYIFLFMGTYMILFGIQFIITITLGHACDRTPGMVNKLDSYVSPIYSNFTSFSFSKTINKLAYCKNDTLLDTIGVNLDTFNITNGLNQVINFSNGTLNQLDLNTLINNSTSQLNSLNINLGNINSGYLNNITNYKNQMLLVKNQTSDLSNFGFNNTLLVVTFNELNNASISIGGQRWAENNITNLNSSAVPYITDRNYFQTKKDSIITLIAIRTNATIRSNNINNNITTIIDRLNDIQYSLNETLKIKNTFGNITYLISLDLSNITRIANSAKSNFTRLFNDFVSLANNGLSSLNFLLSCAKIGTYYKDQIQTNLCTNSLSFILLGSIASICLGLSMCLLYPVLLEGTKRIGHEYRKLEPKQNVQNNPTYHYEMTTIQNITIQNPTVDQQNVPVLSGEPIIQEPESTHKVIEEIPPVIESIPKKEEQPILIIDSTMDVSEPVDIHIDQSNNENIKENVDSLAPPETLNPIENENENIKEKEESLAPETSDPIQSRNGENLIEENEKEHQNEIGLNEGKISEFVNE